jgi:hypothetical protein
MLPAQVGVACGTVVVHALLHEPQLFLSVVVSTHVEPHGVGEGGMQPVAHAYEPADPAHFGVLPVHATPHAPQLLAVSTCVSQPTLAPPSQCA